MRATSSQTTNDPMSTTAHRIRVATRLRLAVVLGWR
jgi:hypothetical protein